MSWIILLNHLHSYFGITTMLWVLHYVTFVELPPATNVNEKFKEWKAKKKHIKDHGSSETCNGITIIIHFISFMSHWKQLLKRFHFSFSRLALKLKFYDLHVHVHRTMRKPKKSFFFRAFFVWWTKWEKRYAMCFLYCKRSFNFSPLEKWVFFSLSLRYEIFAWSSFIPHRNLIMLHQLHELVK